MARISEEIINEIRNKTDIVEIVSGYIPLTKRGKNFFGVCPFHDDHSPSMSVNSEKQIFTCFSCGATGNVFTFVMDYEHISFIEAVKILGEKLGINVDVKGKIEKSSKNNLEYEIYDLASSFYQNNIYSSLGKNAIEYLEKRKIDIETIKKFKIGLSTSRSSLTELLVNKGYDINKLIDIGLTNDYSKDQFINRIMFPIHNLEGQVVAFSGRIYNTKDSSKYINTKETNIFKKGNILYNYHLVKEHLKKKDSLIIMEGFMDVIRASTIGINNCIATMGTAVTKEQALLIKKLTNNVILCFDGDDAGEEATIACYELLEKYDLKIKVVRLEEGMDPDEYIIKKGESLFLNRLANAKDILDYKMETLKNKKNLNDIKEVSHYIDLSIKEIIKEKDDILIELALKKLSKEFDIDYDKLYQRYNSLKEKNKVQKEDVIKKKEHPKANRYLIAERSIILAMLKSSEVINIYENKIAYMPTEEARLLANEILYYYKRFGKVEVADMISHLESENNLLTYLKNIIPYDFKEEYSLEEIEDYVKVLNEYLVNKKLKKLKEELKNETDQKKQIEILNKIMEMKEVLL